MHHVLFNQQIGKALCQEKAYARKFPLEQARGAVRRPVSRETESGPNEHSVAGEILVILIQ